MKYIEDLKNIRATDVKIAGGKGAVIGELMHLGFNTPSGFVVLTNAYKYFSKDGLSNDLKNEISMYCKKIGGLFAVRSSATCEDSQKASWAGELETFLNVKKQNVPDMIMRCWASLFSPRVNNYKKQKNNQLSKNIMVAVVIQKMIKADIAGVCFTADPTTNDTTKIVIECTSGLGEDVVSGNITPDYYLIDKNAGKILERSEKMNLLNNNKVRKLVNTCKSIENYFGKPQDIEWAFVKDKLFILQSRPITTLLN